VAEPDPPVADAEKLMAQGVGAFRHTWTHVQGLKIHSLVSSASVSLDAPVIVLVHDSGLSGRYMIPTAQQLTTNCRVYVPDLPGFGDSDKPARSLTCLSSLKSMIETGVPPHDAARKDGKEAYTH
jgi:pimeloyl-ACP methyl ester carboxylesterase